VCFLFQLEFGGGLKGDGRGLGKLSFQAAIFVNPYLVDAWSRDLERSDSGNAVLARIVIPPIIGGGEIDYELGTYVKLQGFVPVEDCAQFAYLLTFHAFATQGAVEAAPRLTLPDFHR